MANDTAATQSFDPMRPDRSQALRAFFNTPEPMPIEVLEYTLPTWTAGYLINGEADGLTDAEIATIDAFLTREGVRMVSMGEDEWFAHSSDLRDGLGATVATFYAHQL